MSDRLSRDEIAKHVDDFKWYHTIDLGDGIVTKGQYNHRPLLRHYGLPESLAGKRVLDVGPAHGFFAFEMESRGAAVTTVELPAWHDHDAGAALKAQNTDAEIDRQYTKWLHDTLEFAIRARGSSVTRRFKSIYDITREDEGEFDLVFCASVLLHLTDPLRAMAALRKVTRNYAILCTAGDFDPGDGQPRALFYGTPMMQTFWVPNEVCFERLALTAGFSRVEPVSTFLLKSVDGEFNTPHITIKAFA